MANRFNDFDLAYLHIIEGVTQGPREVPGGFDLQILRRAFRGLYIANNGYDLDLARKARRRNLADFIAFGPALPRQSGSPEAPAYRRSAERSRSSNLLRGGTAGYIDYPFLTAAERGAP